MSRTHSIRDAVVGTTFASSPTEGGFPAERVDEMLWLVRLGDAADRHVGAYSLGMRQRLSLAAAPLGDPPVLVLDEPGNGLDPQGIRDLRELLRARAANGHTIFVSSHLLSEVEHLADELVVLKKGRLVASGSLAELQKEATLVRTPSPPSLREALEVAGAVVQPQEHDALVVRGLHIDEIGDRAHDAGIALHELSPHSGSSRICSWTGRVPQRPMAPRISPRRSCHYDLVTTRTS